MDRYRHSLRNLLKCPFFFSRRYSDNSTTYNGRTCILQGVGGSWKRDDDISWTCCNNRSGNTWQVEECHNTVKPAGECIMEGISTTSLSFSLSKVRKR